MSIIVVNHSPWPTSALRVLAKWIAEREGLGEARAYTFTFRNTRRMQYRGSGTPFGQTITMHRRFDPVTRAWPFRTKDHRFQWSTEEVYRSRLELLVGIMAHEAHHATAGHPRFFRKNGRLDRATMEFRCNRAGQEAVEALRKDWLTLRAQIRGSMRRDRNRHIAAQERAVVRRADSTPKLLHGQTMLKRWQARLKLAGTKVKRYRRQVVYYEGRAAAKTSNPATQDGAPVSS